jgi:hypothetical protein
MPRPGDLRKLNRLRQFPEGCHTASPARIGEAASLHVAQRHARVKAVMNACRSARVAEPEAPPPRPAAPEMTRARPGRYLVQSSRGPGRAARAARAVKRKGRGDNDQALTLDQVAASARRQPDQRGDHDRDEQHHHDDGGRDRAVPAVLLVHVSPSCG